MRKTLSIIGILATMAPVMAQAKTIELADREVKVTDRVLDGSIVQATVGVYPCVSPNGVPFCESEDQKQKRKIDRDTNLKQHKEHCKVDVLDDLARGNRRRPGVKLDGCSKNDKVFYIDLQ